MNVIAEYSREAVGRPGRRVHTRIEQSADGTRYKLVSRWFGGTFHHAQKVGEYRDRAEAVQAWREHRNREPMPKDLRTETDPTQREATG